MTDRAERRIRAVLIAALHERLDTKRSTLDLAQSAAAAIKHLHELAHDRFGERILNGERS